MTDWVKQIPRPELNTLHHALIIAHLKTPTLEPATREQFTVLADRLWEESVRRGPMEDAAEQKRTAARAS